MVIGHPGHELRVHHWIEIAKPLTFVLTDGSGRGTRSRLGSTTRVLDRAGATCGDIYGCFTDAEVYAHIRTGNVAVFAEVMRGLAAAFIDQHIEYVAADALEGFNPSHDVCRYLVNGAVALVRQRTGRVLTNFDFVLDGRPDECAESVRAEAVSLQLDAEALNRKLAAARAYPELKSETERALARFGTVAFATELLRPVFDERQGIGVIDPDPPYYEQFGEQQVRAGFYDSVIRYRQHVQPLVLELWRQAGLTGIAAAPTVTTTSAASGRAI
ncbi:MAG: hypothetical protein ABI051_03950 [Vicinamibacterales bacterium]